MAILPTPGLADQRIGATPEEWAHWAEHLGLVADLLPTVQDQTARINPRSTLRELGKVPSRFGDNGLVVGFPRWTEATSTRGQLAAWSRCETYGICLQTRHVRALDIDVNSPANAGLVAELVETLCPGLPRRTRAGSSRCAFIFRLAGEYGKRSFKLADGVDAVEFLGDGQQLVVAGTHKSGARNEWAGGLPRAIPELTAGQFEALWTALKDTFAAPGTEHRAGGGALTERRHKGQAADPFADLLVEAGAVLAETQDGKLHVTCPNAAEHSADNGPSQTTYFSAGLGGRAERTVHCLHAHCEGKPLLSMLAEQHGLAEQLRAIKEEEVAGDFEVVELTAEEQAESDRIRERNAKRHAVVQLETDDERAARREYEKKLAATGEHVPIPTQRHMTGSEMLAGLVYIEEGARVAFHDRPRSELPFSEFKLAHAASTGTARNAAGRATVRHLADLWLKDRERKTVRTTTFAPGRGAFCDTPDGEPALNRWREFTEPAPPNWADLAAPLLGHVAYLLPVEAERERFLDWLGHIAQRPGELPSAHYLMIAKQTGIGRNWLAYALARAFAGYTALGFDLSDTLRTGFNGALSEKLLVVVDELHEGGPRPHAGRTAEKLKSMLTEATRRVNPKYGRQRVEFNTARFLMFSNHDAALPLADNDRRVIVIENPSQRRTPSYYAKLYGLLDAPGFGPAVREALRRRDISRFNPGELAPMNEAKRRAIDAGRSEVEKEVRDVAEAWPSDCITVARLQLEVQTALDARVSITAAAVQAGYVACGRVRIGGRAGRRYAVLALRNADRWRRAPADELLAEVQRGEVLEEVGEVA